MQYIVACGSTRVGIGAGSDWLGDGDGLDEPDGAGSDCEAPPLSWRPEPEDPSLGDGDADSLGVEDPLGDDGASPSPEPLAAAGAGAMRTPLTAKSSTRTTNAERTTRNREAMSEFRWEPAENMEWVDAILFLNRDGARGAGGSLRAGYGGCRGCRVHRAGNTAGSRCKFNDQSTMGTHDFGHEFITFTRFPVIRLADCPPCTVQLPCGNAEIS